MKRYLRCRYCLIVFFCLLLTACTVGKPPLEFSPDGEIVQKAIALQLANAESQISQQLNTTKPTFTISQVRVDKIDPVFIESLPSYHLQGTYNLQLNLSRQEVLQKGNAFDLYLQRQVEGKTWRLLRRWVNGNDKPQWRSYLIQ